MGVMGVKGTGFADATNLVCAQHRPQLDCLCWNPNQTQLDRLSPKRGRVSMSPAQSALAHVYPNGSVKIP